MTKAEPSKAPADGSGAADQDDGDELDREEQVPLLGYDAGQERGEQGPGDPGIEGRDAKGEELVGKLVHPHDLGGDVTVPDRHERRPDPGSLQVLGQRVEIPANNASRKNVLAMPDTSTPNQVLGVVKSISGRLLFPPSGTSEPWEIPAHLRPAGQRCPVPEHVVPDEDEPKVTMAR